MCALYRAELASKVVVQDCFAVRFQFDVLSGILLLNCGPKVTEISYFER